MQPDLTSYDAILINTSAGKDSQAMSEIVCRAAARLGIIDRVEFVHCDLGRCEWQGTRELAEEHAAHYGRPIHIVTRPQGDLLDQIEARGKFPSNTARYCTSDHKRGQVMKVLTALGRRYREAGVARPRILNCIGIRSAESPARSKLVAFAENKKASNSAKRVDDWLPIFDFDLPAVWSTIKQAGTRWHYAYDQGMPRLSCCFCIFASRDALLLAAEHNRELLDTYVDVERKIGHTFTQKTSLESIRIAFDNGERAGRVQTWEM